MKIKCQCGSREFWVRLKATVDYLYFSDHGILSTMHTEDMITRLEEPTADHTYTCVDCGKVAAVEQTCGECHGTGVCLTCGGTGHREIFIETNE